MPSGGPALVEPAAVYTGGNPLPPYLLIPLFPPGQVFPSSTSCLGAKIWDPSSPLEAIKARAPQAVVRFDDGTNPVSAAALAAASDVAIVFVNRWETENCDLNDLNLPDDQDGLVSAVANANRHTVVVLETGGPTVMPWLEQVSAVLEAWYPGQRGGEAVAKLLFGDANPSGKLPLTFPRGVNDLPRPQIPFFAPADAAPFDVNYTEGSLVGYKWFDQKNRTPLFPFGFGLSYSSFVFSHLDAVSNDGYHDEHMTVRVSFDVTNTSSRAGAEVAQVYVRFPASGGEPPRRLVGWQKVWLDPHETRHVTLEIDADGPAHPFSFWSASDGRWETADGEYTLYVGDSSRSTPLRKGFSLHGRHD
jgi:beta-glucosidase